jgi:hypothetical protein
LLRRQQCAVNSPQTLKAAWPFLAQPGTTTRAHSTTTGQHHSALKHHHLINQSPTPSRTALLRPPSEPSPGPSACDSWPADSDETNPTLCSASVLDSQAQCQPHVTRRRALRDYRARASESRRSRQREPACRPRCTPPPRCLVDRLPARTQKSGRNDLYPSAFVTISICSV